MVRSRSHVVIARLNDEELKLYNWLLRFVVGVTYSKNKSNAFRKLLRAMERLAREREDKKREGKFQRYLSELEWSDFQPPVATKGPPEVEVEGPDEIEILEENDVYY